MVVVVVLVEVVVVGPLFSGAGLETWMPCSRSMCSAQKCPDIFAEPDPPEP